MPKFDRADVVVDHSFANRYVVVDPTETDGLISVVLETRMSPMSMEIQALAETIQYLEPGTLSYVGTLIELAANGDVINSLPAVTPRTTR